MAALADAIRGAGVNRPHARVPVARQRALLRAATLGTLLLLLAITVLGLPLRTTEAPFGLVSLQFATSPEMAERMLHAWAVVPRPRLLLTHGLDLVLPVAYAVTLGLAARRTEAIAHEARKASRITVGAVVAAALVDQVENVAMGLTILVGPSWGSVLVTLAAATAKWTLLFVAAGAFIVAVSTAQRARMTVS